MAHQVVEQKKVSLKYSVVCEIQTLVDIAAHLRRSICTGFQTQVVSFHPESEFNIWKVRSAALKALSLAHAVRLCSTECIL